MKRYARSSNRPGFSPLITLPEYAGWWADDPDWANPGVGNAVSSWRTAGTLTASGAYTDPTNGLVLPGVAGNAASTPDEAATSITGDQCGAIWVAMDDWTPASGQTFAAKQHGAGDTTLDWRFFYSATLGNIPALRIYDTVRGAAVQYQAPAFTPPTDGTGLWIGWELDVNNGSGSEVRFYRSDASADANPATLSWTSLGAPATDGAAVAVRANVATLLGFGAYGSGLDQAPLDGAIRRFWYASGATFGTASPVLNVDFRRPTTGFFTAATGQTVTLASTFYAAQGTAARRPTLTTSALLNNRRVVDFDGTDDRLEITTGVSLAQPFEVWWIGVLDTVTTTESIVGLNSTSADQRVGYTAAPAHTINMGTALDQGTPTTGAARANRYVANGVSSIGYGNGVAFGAGGNAGSNAVNQFILGAGRTAPSTYSHFLDGKTALLLILPTASITQEMRTRTGQWAASFYSVPSFAGAFG